jgi:glycosyltransferase involved in cell wall biosynthesis
MNNPKVSIIIPCYNAEKWIEQCVNSALNQTYENLEVIVVDNESKDGSLQILTDKFSQNSKVIIDTAENIYPNCWDEARQKGFSISTGEYLFTLASDDIYGPKFVENNLKFILKAPDKVKVLQSPIVGIDVSGNTSTAETKHFYKNISQFKTLALQRCPVNSPTTVYNRELYENGLLQTKPELYGGAADYDLYCNLAENGVFIFPANVFLGYYYRWHPEQATWSVQKEGKNYDKMIQDYWKGRWT